MPRGNPTPVRSVRVPDALWARVGEVAHEQGRSVSEVVVDALTRYERKRR